MRLTDEEKRMLAGEHGEAPRLSMEVLTRIGEVYGAERLAPVSSVHASCMYPNFGAAVDILEKFRDLGGKFQTVTTVNPTVNPDNVNRWADLPEPPELKSASTRQMSAIRSMGVIPNWSCTPYFQGNLPRVGECISWIESSAVIFVNSVLGARTNRTTMGIDVASAIAGRAPEFGLLLDGDRAGNVLVKVEFEPQTMFDFNTIGYIVGKACSGKVPVIEGLPVWTTANHLKVMGAAAATRGGLALYHAVGITPEAPTRKKAFRGKSSEFDISIKKKDLKGALEDMNTIKKGGVQAVLVGCPHPRVSEIKELAGLLAGKKVREDIKFCLFISSDVLNFSRQMGYIDVLEACGVRLFEGDCIVFHNVNKWGWKNVATNSAKYACTLPSGPYYLDVLYTDINGCVDLATK